MDNNIREQFIPTEKLDILGIDGSGRQAKEGMKKPKHFSATVVRMGLPTFVKGLSEDAAIQVFEQLGEAVERAMPAFIEWGAVVDHFAEGSVQVLFKDERTGVASAVGAAIELRENLLKDQKLWRGMTFGLSYGHVILGVLGGEGRYNVMSLSYEASIAKSLQQLAVKYSASILVTERLLEHDPSIALKYTCRLLGKFYFDKIDQALKVYDFYDGDEIAIRTAKRKTALLFDKGVSFFLEGDFAQARSYFIEVIKANRLDKAARAYLSLCDNYRENPPETPEGLCIERL